MSAPPHPGTNEDEPGESATSIAPTDGCPLPSSAPPTMARAAGGGTSTSAATMPTANLPTIDPRLLGIVFLPVLPRYSAVIPPTTATVPEHQQPARTCAQLRRFGGRERLGRRRASPSMNAAIA